jgi:hypothetical protein
MSRESGLHQVPEADLLRLLRALARDQLPSPITRAGLLLTQFAGIEAHLDKLVGQNKQAAITLLSAVLRERRARSGSTVTVIWDGPAPSTFGARGARDAVLELVATAQTSLLLTGADLERDHSVLRAVSAAMQGRSLQVSIVLRSIAACEWANQARVADELCGNSPLRTRLYAPDPLQIRGSIPLCVLADAQRGLLLAGVAPQLETDERDLTAGLQIDHVEAVRALAAPWQALIDSGALVPLDALQQRI